MSQVEIQAATVGVDDQTLLISATAQVVLTSVVGDEMKIYILEPDGDNRVSTDVRVCSNYEMVEAGAIHLSSTVAVDTRSVWHLFKM